LDRVETVSVEKLCGCSEAHLSRTFASLVDLAMSYSTSNRARRNGSWEMDMAGERTPFRRTKSIAGAALVGLGTFLQYQNMVEAVARLRDVLCANGSETLGVPPAVI